MTFHVGVSGAAISFCICGLTVSGTGTVRAGTSRGGVCAAADDVETANAMATPEALSPRQTLTCDMAFMMSLFMRRMYEQVNAACQSGCSTDPRKTLYFVAGSFTSTPAPISVSRRGRSPGRKTPRFLD